MKGLKVVKMNFIYRICVYDNDFKKTFTVYAESLKCALEKAKDEFCETLSNRKRNELHTKLENVDNHTVSEIIDIIKDSLESDKGIKL